MKCVKCGHEPGIEIVDSPKARTILAGLKAEVIQAGVEMRERKYPDAEDAAIMWRIYCHLGLLNEIILPPA